MKLTLIQRITAYSLAVVFVATASLIAVAFSYLSLQRNAEEVDRLSLVDKAAVDVARGLGELILTEGAKSSRDLIASSVKTLEDNLTAEATPEHPKAAEAVASWRTIRTELDKLVALKGIGPTDDDSLILFGGLQNKLSALIKMLDQMKAEAEAQSQVLLVRVFWGLGAALTVVLVAVLASAWVIRSTLLNRVGGDPALVVSAVQEVAKGNLASQVPVAASDRQSILYETQRMRESLLAIVTDVRSRAEKISEVSHQTVNVSTTVVEQSQVVADELASQAKAIQAAAESSSNTYVHAQSAQRSAQAASQAAEQGGLVVGRVVETMRHIGSSSQKIGEIISVIDSIAFQTNILALNAAVEAARAGEQGRGFAVVASEVRALAQRSATAANEIKSLIDTSVGAVRDGQAQVEHAGQTMSDIVAGVRAVNDLIESIFQSVSDQDQTLKGLAGSVQNVEALTQQNLESVYAVSGVSEKLQHQAMRLAELVANFRA